MRKYYRFALAALLAGLGACSSEVSKTANTEQSATLLAPATTAAADTVPRSPVANAAIQPAAPAPPTTAVRPALPAPEALPQTKTQAVAAPAANAPHPTTLADATTGTGEESDSTQAANAAELEQFMAAGLPAPQQFLVRPGRDTLLTGAQGTQLLVAAGAWELPIGSGPVEVKMQEFYQMPDIVLAGLTTTAGPELLETGGMVHLEATANGRPVRLWPGAAVHLRMPAAQRKEGMQLFQSPGRAPGARAGLNWQLPPAPGLATAAPPKPAGWKADFGSAAPRGRWGRRGRRRRVKAVHPQYTAQYIEVPEYPGGEGRAIKALPRLIGYPPATLARLRKALRTGRRMGKAEFVELRRASTLYDEHMLRLVHASFQVDTLGRAYQFEVAPGTDVALGRAVLGALGKMSAWQPALMPRLPALDSLTAVPAFGRITAYFSASGKVVVEDSITWNRPSSWAFHEAAFKAKVRRAEERRLAYYASLSPRQRRTLDSTAQVRLYTERDRLYQQLGTQESASINRDILYNELSTQSLGWINCDRFLSPAPRIEYVVNAALRNTIVTLVFRDIRAAMSSSNIGSRTAFDNVPTGQAATVVALRREKGTTYLAKHEVLIDPKGLGELSFHPVTIAELRTELASLQ